MPALHRWLLAALLLLGAAARPAQAVPSFAQQTGQPCAACHVGAFGPQLKPYGQEFKLYGYVAAQGTPTALPLAAMAQASFTRTGADQAGPATRWFARNDNPAFDQAALFYAGRITGSVGAFIQVTYDGVARQPSLDNVDIRHAREGEVLGAPIVLGLTLNNNPSVEDLWNSTPAWSFPYNRSRLAPTPSAAALVDGRLAQRVAGLGVYALWDEWLYADVTAYQGLGPGLRNLTGITPIDGVDTTQGLIPYWRVAVLREFGRHHVELGTFGLHGSVHPGGDRSAGRTDTLTDVALDANWQWVRNPRRVTSDVVSTHLAYIREQDSLGASRVLAGTRGCDALATFRADASYSLGATVTPSVQYFANHGTADARYWGTASARPDSAGMIAELAYVPFGKPSSSLRWLNIRLAAQYVAYTRLDGEAQHASGSDALYLSVWGAVRF